MLLIIDNYDSFTYNLARYFTELGVRVEVVRNDECSVDEIRQRKPSHLVISPGPCTPARAGVSIAAVQALAGQVPVLGVCLGHQAIGEAFGGKAVHAGVIMHGKVSSISHAGVGVFKGLPSPFKVTRYHSLVLEPASLPAALEVTAWAKDAQGVSTIMGIRHRELAVEGVQFHPESVLSEHGHELLRNFLEAH